MLQVHAGVRAHVTPGASACAGVPAPDATIAATPDTSVQHPQFPPMDHLQAERLAQDLAHASAALQARHDALVAALDAPDPRELMRHCLDLQANHLLVAGLLQETMQLAHRLQAERGAGRTLFAAPRKRARSGTAPGTD
jgi:hypothetical protein